MITEKQLKTFTYGDVAILDAELGDHCLYSQVANLYIAHHVLS